MPLRTSRLGKTHEYRHCIELQRAVLGDRARTVLPVPALVAVSQSGGLVLGTSDSEPDGSILSGVLVDLVANADGYAARETVFHGVHPTGRNRGVGYALRAAERTICQSEAVDVIAWSLDPLRSEQAHLAFNKLGAIATDYRTNLYGEVHDTPNLGLETDRLRVEWWLDAPRVVSIMDQANPPSHLKLGVHEMDVLTKTSLLPGSIRRLVDFDESPRAQYVLVEIPVDIDRVRAIDLSVAQEWRLRSREAFQLLFEHGYVVVGFVHEGGRSFHLFRKADRGTVLRHP